MRCAGSVLIAAHSRARTYAALRVGKYAATHMLSYEQIFGIAFGGGALFTLLLCTIMLCATCALTTEPPRDCTQPVRARRARRYDDE